MGFGKDWNEDGNVTPLEDVGTVFAMGMAAELLKPKTKEEGEFRQGVLLGVLGIIFVLFIAWVCLCALVFGCVLLFELYFEDA